jgi:hypothetical protein
MLVLALCGGHIPEKDRGMWLGSLCGRPLMHDVWGWIAGWIYDVWLDAAAKQVVAFEICEPDRMQFQYVAPFAVHRSVRYGLGIDIDPDALQVLEPVTRWTSVRNLAQVDVVSLDGEWSCAVTDADCDPETWRLTGFRLRRRWWEIFAKRTLSANRVVHSGADLLVIGPRSGSNGS